MRKMIFLCLLVAPLLLGFKTSGDTIKAGVAVPLTGGAKQIAADVRNGVALAADEWNKKGGVLGKRIELVVKDDQGDPKIAATAANELVASGVAGVIGHVNSGASLAAIKYYDHAGIPMISPASTNAELTDKGYLSAFRTCGKNDQQAEIAADFVIKLKLKKVALIHDQTAYGQGLASEFMRQIQGKVEPVYYAGFDPQNRNFQEILKTITLKKPDLIYFCGTYFDAGDFLKQAGELGIHTLFMGGDGVANPELIKIAGDVKDAYFTANPDIEKRSTAKNFIAAYEQKFGAVGEYSAYAYDAANALFTAIEKAGTTSGKEVIDKLHTLKFDGALGAMKFDVHGDVEGASYVIWTVKNGKLAEY